MDISSVGVRRTVDGQPSIKRLTGGVPVLKLGMSFGERAILSKLFVH